MPETPRTPRRTSTARRDAARPQESPPITSKIRPHSVYESTSVQDRIRQWQAQGAANALAPDALSVHSVPASVASSDVSRAASPAAEPPNTAPARKSRWPTRELETPTEGRESRSSSAPRKRVISDDHWRAKREAAMGSPAADRAKGVKTPHHDLTYTSTARREDREAHRERRGRARLSKDNIGSSAAANLPDSSPQGLGAYIEHELAGHLAATPESQHRSPQESPEVDDNTSQHSFSVNDDTSHAVSPSKYADTLGQPSLSGSKRAGRSGGLLSKTREMFNKAEAPTPSHRVPSIQAWLEDQPDPFVESSATVLPDVEVPKPLKRRSRRTRTTPEKSVADPNKIWDSVIGMQQTPLSPGSVAEGDRGPAERTTPSSMPDRGAEDDSPNNLRRRGAARTRRSRNSSTPVQQLPAKEGPNTMKRLATVPSEGELKQSDLPPSYDVVEQLAPLEGSGLKRRLTTHEDLMSVLSLPMHRKSTRTRRKPPNQTGVSASQVLEGLVAEEAKYVKELRTLVDGVVPVLLQAVLSKSNTIAAAGLFASASDPADFSFTKPIIDMGIALERLKSLHSRIPIQSIDALLTWAKNAHKAYNDYIKAWRLGFHDVVVNLEPLEDGQETVDSGMARDAEGDIVNAKGEKADVAFLLKRPLVRVKNLAKTFESIQSAYGKPLAAEVAQAFADLTAAARQRHREEQARLEDEAAASLDASRARNVRTLGAQAGVSIDKTRKVRARDNFDLTLWHTTGQRLDCQIEMVFRDNSPDAPSGGDVLICEMDEVGKWLLFPPVNLSSISARRGEDDIDLVVMIRGPSGIGQEWQELLALKTDDPEAVNEWMTMLGSCPLPPKLNRTRSFLDRRDAEAKKTVSRPSTADSKSETISDTTNGDQHDIPLGEPSVIGSEPARTPKSRKALLERFVPRLNLGGGLQSKPFTSWSPPAKVPARKPVPSVLSSDRSTISDESVRSSSRHAKSASAPATPTQGSVTISKQKSPQSRKTATAADQYMMSGALQPSPVPTDTRDAPVRQSPQAQQDRDTTRSLEAAANSQPLTQNHTVPASGRPGHARSLSATPSEGLPAIPKLRGKGIGQTPPSTTIPLTDSIRDQWKSLSGKSHSDKHKAEPRSSQQLYTEDLPSVPTERKALPKTPSADVGAPPPPPHREGSAVHSRSVPKKMDSPPVLTPKSEQKRGRRSSSPLKHEYAPSTASESTADSDSDDGSDASSDTSEDFMSEVKDMPTPLVTVKAGNRRASQLTRPPPSTAPPTSGTRTLAPSDSASQGPYRKVPSSTTVPSTQKSRTIALICSWSDRGVWEQVHPDECSIVVSPGLIEAFEMSAAHSGAAGIPEEGSEDSATRTSSSNQQPLVAFELTPIVPLRRGTALDINIRSPPTGNSKLRTTNNIMFRSRNADECDVLYGMINWARCNNPTYIQLERARPQQPPVSFNVGPAQQGRGRASSWFSFGNEEKRSSYRASSAPMSIGGDSSASNGTMATAISALKRLSASSAFSLNRSSVVKKSGWSRTSGSLYSSNSGTGSGSGSSTPVPSQMGFVPGRDGPNVPPTSADAASGGGMVNNMKIRLYIRKGQNWAHLGSGRLSVLPAPGVGVAATTNGRSEMSSPNTTPVRVLPGNSGPRLPSSGHTPHRVHGNGREKRVVVRKSKKDTDVTLLDAVLGESCFERVMQTGIAVKVWTENQEVAETGGVMMGKEQIYMMQFPGVREAGWVFGLVGSYRYGAD